MDKIFSPIFILLLVLNCNPTKYQSQCDPSSGFFQRVLQLKAMLGDTSSFCGISSSTLSRIITNGNNSTALSVTAFNFTDTVNGLSKTYTGTITGSNIAIDFPYGKITSAIPSITTNAISIQVGNTSFISGVTALDFTNPITFTFFGQAGDKLVYTVSAYSITPVEDTGQTSCYDVPSLQTCASVLATFPRQDGHMADTPNAKGVQTPTTNPGYPSDFITKNSLTGIIWKTCQEGQTGATCTGTADSSIIYSTALTTCSNLNLANSGAGYAGIKNWRLPTIQELIQAEIFVTANINWDVTYFPGNPVNPNLRSSNVIPSTSNSLITNSIAFYGFPRVLANSSASNLRCVSGSSYPSANLQDTGDGTVFDKRSKLYWQKCANGQTNDATCSSAAVGINWQNSLSYCNGLSLAGKQWRLPNFTELVSLIDTSQAAAPYINTSIFIGHPTGATKLFQSSTSVPAGVSYPGRVDFAVPEGVTADDKSPATNGGYQYLARCVSGP